MPVRPIYLDHSATTPLDGVVLEAMMPYLRENFGNPNSIHAWGRRARQAVEEARGAVASLVGAKDREVFFTGGGSEADNLAIKGTALARQQKGRHLITSAIEHHAVLDVFSWLGKQGFDVTVLSVDETGRVSPKDLERALRPDTTLVSIMFANNEIGTLQPVAELGELCRQRDVLFHTDAVQVVGHLPLDLATLPVDLLTMSAHKMYGPKGVGALFVRRGVRIDPLVHGGGQERGLRSGTENVAGIVGFGAAARLARERLAAGEHLKEAELRDHLLEGLLEVDDVLLTGHRTDRLPFHASVCVRFIEGEALLLRLDAAGIGASSGSACTSGSLDPSHVLLALGLDHATAHGSLRLSLGKDTSREDVDRTRAAFREIVEVLRAMSPFGRNK
ncbi:MAG TPA: cysteine desulfurase family protein [Synergistaceae bacterium]|nr:cysteine desulfurase family protein [Synergistaceae bacterium]HQH78548.1 cysteine desulfurase family protein [Synergistaceae bacterium]